jgi:hypothetical protein
MKKYNEFINEEIEYNGFNEDPGLMRFHENYRSNVGEDCWIGDFENQELMDYVIEYLNVKLKDIYREENNPDDPFTATIRKRRLIENRDTVHIQKKRIGDDECYEIYFDSDTYRFEGWVFVREDRSIYFTDE